jgi:2-polyprenyl-6-methoxyphenol hydroxylase-like FAD-dependent oxidoreductase
VAQRESYTDRRYNTLPHKDIDAHLYNTDASHTCFPIDSEGANLAIEDARALAVVVDKYPNDVESAFKMFEKERFMKTTSVVEMSRGFAGLQTPERYELP